MCHRPLCLCLAHAPAAATAGIHHIAVNAGWLMVVPGFLGRHDEARPRRDFLDNHTVQTSTDAWQTSQLFEVLSESSSDASRNWSSRASSRLGVQYAALQICVEAANTFHSFTHTPYGINSLSCHYLTADRDTWITGSSSSLFTCNCCIHTAYLKQSCPKATSISLS